MKEFTKKSVIFLVVSIVVSAGCAQDPAQKEAYLKEKIAKGQELYLSHGCAVCHGPEGYGDGFTAKNYYPPPIDFRDPEAYVNGNSVDAIQRSIQFGMRKQDSAMPAFDHLSKEELTLIATFLNSLQENE